MRIVLLAAVILVLCGCASSGTKIDAAQLDAIRKGQTTIDDIVRKFGRPNFVSKNWDGTQTAAYANTAGRSDAVALLPLMGAGVDSVIFYFDADGILTDFKTMQGAGSRAARAGDPAQAVSGAATSTAISQPARARPEAT